MELILLIVIAVLMIVLLVLSLTKGNNQTQAEQLQIALRQQMQENREELNRSIRKLRMEMTQVLNQNMQQLQDVLHKNMMTTGELQRQYSSISRQPETTRRLQFSSMAILTSSPKAKVGATGASLLNRRLRVNVFTDAVPQTTATTFTPRWWLCMRLKKRASRTAASSDCTRRTKSAARATLSIGCRRVERGSGTLDS